MDRNPIDLEDDDYSAADEIYDVFMNPSRPLFCGWISAVCPLGPPSEEKEKTD